MAETLSESPDLLSSAETPEVAAPYLSEVTAEPAEVFEHVAEAEIEAPTAEDHEALTMVAQAAAQPARGEVLEPLKSHEIIQLLLMIDTKLDENRDRELNPGQPMPLQPEVSGDYDYRMAA